MENTIKSISYNNYMKIQISMVKWHEEFLANKAREKFIIYNIFFLKIQCHSEA